jgi:hypothetical protein
VRHDVPYYCQWESPELVAEFVSGARAGRDDPKWAGSGARDPEEYEFWAWRTCGIACLRMMLAYRREAVPPSVPLAERCTVVGGYIRHRRYVDGLIYVPFVRWIEGDFGIKATTHPELEAGQIVATVREGGLAMISVHPTIRTPWLTPSSRGGHLVLVTGYDEGGLLIHNPSGLPGQTQRHARIGFEVLDRFYAGRGILIRP